MRQIRKVLFAFVGVLLPAMAAADTLPVIQNVNAYESLSLNGEWNYIVDVQEEGYYDYRMNPTPWGFFRNAKPQKPEDLIEYDFDKSPTMQIPGDWNTQDERLFFYEGTVWFKKNFNVKTDDGFIEGRNKALLYFGAVNYDCRVWVNGKEAGHHVGGFTPFNYDVTEMLKEGENTVIVKVDNKRHAEDVPTLIFDWWNYGGITRDVKLVKVTPVYIEDYNVQMVSLEGRRLAFSARLSKAEAGHTVTIDIPELKLKKAVTTDADGRVQMFAKFKPQLWSPENPKLYQVNISLDNATTITDEIGFRTIETRDKQILLNGQPIFLKGISIHDEKPNGGGRANSTEDARQLLTWAKELGCNFVRLAHYPHHEYMVREAERMGILVWSEIPDRYDQPRPQPRQHHHLEHRQRDAPLCRARRLPRAPGTVCTHARLHPTDLNGDGGNGRRQLREPPERQYEQVCRCGIIQPVYRLVPRRERCAEDEVGDPLQQACHHQRVRRRCEERLPRCEEPALDGGVPGEPLPREHRDD